MPYSLFCPCRHLRRLPPWCLAGRIGALRWQCDFPHPCEQPQQLCLPLLDLRRAPFRLPAHVVVDGQRQRGPPPLKAPPACARSPGCRPCRSAPGSSAPDCRATRCTGPRSAGSGYHSRQRLVGRGLARQQVLHCQVLDGQVLRPARHLLVEPQQHELGHGRAARVQVAQVMAKGALLVARQPERARRRPEIVAVAHRLQQVADPACLAAWCPCRGCAGA